jgi:hypothetical protein
MLKTVNKASYYLSKAAAAALSYAIMIVYISRRTQEREKCERARREKKIKVV